MYDRDDLGFEKRIATSGDDFLSAGESRVVPMTESGGHLTVDDRISRGHVKTAAAEEAMAECAKIKPKPGRVYVLVIGLGSEEFWGVNNNGDSFPENALLGLPPKDTTMAFFDQFKARIRPGWGYKTFLKGHVFEEHKNTSPSLAIGGIHATFWNNRMHRVENLIWIDRLNPKGKKWADMADRGDTIATSMACRVPFDRCSICGNLAPTRAQYCNHLRPGRAGYSLRQVQDDGRAVAMVNDFPHFFDESCVGTPAAPEALMIMKVASQQTEAAKFAATKAAEIKKTGPDLPLDVAIDEFAGLYNAESPIPSVVLDKLRQFSAPEVMAGLKKVGMMLRPSELFSLCFGDALPAKLAFEVDAAAPYVPPVDGWRQSIPDNAQIKFAGLNPFNVDRVTNLVLPFAEKRSYLEPYLTMRLLRNSGVKRAHAQPAYSLDAVSGYLAIYHGICKAASGEFGYGITQIGNTLRSAHGAY